MKAALTRFTITLLLLAVMPCTPLCAQDAESAGSGAVTAKKVAGVSFDIRDYPGPQDRIRSLADDLVSLEPGMDYSPDLLVSSVSLLKLSGRFEEVAPTVSETPGGVEVSIRLKPSLQIRDVKISGEYPLFEQDILNVMTAYVGNYLQPGTVEAQERLIVKFLEDEGYIHPKAGVTVIDDRKDGTVVLDVSLDKGPFFKLKELKISGNKRFSDTRLKVRMSIWERSLFIGSSGRFIEKSLTQDIKNLNSFYWASGYADADVSYAVQKIKSTGNVRITVEVREGPLFKVSFPGAERFYAFTLKKQLTLFKEGNRGGSGVRKSARNIRDLYLSSGYPKIKVKTGEDTVVEGGAEVHRVRFDIDEGVRALVSGVSFTGNAAFTDDELGKRVETGTRTFPVTGKKLFSKDVLMQDIHTLKTLYVDRGFAAADVGADLTWSTDGKSVSVVFHINEGVQTLVSSIAFEGITILAPERTRSCISMTEGTPFSQGALKKDESSLATCISERGYPHVQVRSTVESADGGKEARVKYSVYEGPLVRMGSTYFNGNFMTRKMILQRELDMEKGDPFSLSKMVKGQNAIRDMNVFNAVKFKTLGLREKLDQVTVVADLEEKKPFYVQASVGYESNVGMYGKTRVGDHNLLGLNREVWVGGEISQVNERAELGLNAPRLWGTQVSGVYNLYWERREDFNQNFGLRTVGYNLGFIKKFSRRVFTSVNFSYERRDEFIIDDALQAELDADKSASELADEEEALKPRSIFVISPAITYDTRDSFMHPRRGTFSYGVMDISNGLLNSRAIDDFIRYKADVRQYATPFDRLTLACMAKAGYIMSTSTADQIPDDQLFYLGGVLNVRGYRENMLLFDENGNPVGGRLSLVGSLEARFAVFNGIEIPLFFDIGTIRDTNAQSVVPDTRASYGTGLRYITPIGPISFVYGHKLKPEDGESPYEWHFSLGYTF